jgi:hypothetical protein
MSGAAADQIKEATMLLEKYGIKKEVTPRMLVATAKELGKPLRDALAYIAKVMATAEGVT